MDYRWEVTNIGRRSPGRRVPMVAQIHRLNVDTVKAVYPFALARLEIPHRISAVLSYPLFGAREALGNETPRGPHPPRWRGRVAARGARAAAEDAGDRISQRHSYVEPRSRTGVGLDAVIHRNT